MSDWAFLNKHRVREPVGRIPDWLCSTDVEGFNGMFRFQMNGRSIRCVSSSDEDWEHVSITIEGEARPPSWEIMCKIKDLYWDDEQWVCQYHPPKSDYINNHPGCLHLWRPIKSVLPTPPASMVGIKNVPYKLKL